MIAIWFLLCCLALIGGMGWCTWQDVSRRRRYNEATKPTPEQIELLRICQSMADEYEARYQPLHKGGG